MHCTAIRLAAKCIMFDQGFFLSWQAVRRQLAAMPNDLYLVRLIHQTTGPWWPGGSEPDANPWAYARCRAPDQSRPPAGLDSSQCHSPGTGHRRRHCQTIGPALWGRLGQRRLAPSGKAGWLHQPEAPAAPGQPLRSLGATPARRVGLGQPGAEMVEAAGCQVTRAPTSVPAMGWLPAPPARDPMTPAGHPSIACEIYQAWLHRLRIPQRFPQPDWSIADKWIAKELLRQGALPALVETLLRCGSPSFPRRHAAPADYLRRTLARALGELSGAAFPAPAPSAHCVAELRPPPSPGHTPSSEIHVGPPADCGGRTST